jgi:pimeloyl-ACP methyl ester carboxylesterase
MPVEEADSQSTQALEDHPVDSASVESRLIDVDGIRIHYLYTEGPAPAIVLVPGGMIDSAALTWKYVLAGLAGERRVYVPELPGYGKSDKPDASYTTEYYTDFLIRFIERTGEQQVVLCGSSMAGAVVLGAAFSRPERVLALILSGGYGVQDRVPFHTVSYAVSRIPRIEDFFRWLFRARPFFIRLAFPVAVWNLRCITRELVEDAYTGVDDPRSLEAFRRWMLSDVLPRRTRTNFTDRLHRLTMPVLLLHGKHDLMMPVRYTQRAAGLLPNAELHLFNAGHLVPRECPQETVRIMRQFIRRHAPAQVEPL